MAELIFRSLIFDLRNKFPDWRFVFVGIWLFAGTALADEPLKIEPVERWSNVFAESQTRWTYRVSADRAFQANVAWRLTVNQRTLGSGEINARGDADKSADITIPLRWPTVKEGVVLAAQLTVSAGDVRHERPVWIFPRDPFADRREWLESLKLTVFDPPGDTVKVLIDSQVPHERVRTREGLDDVADGIIIVGEGVSLKKHESLIDDLRALAARGIPVLCLASEDGEFSFSSEKPLASAIQLRRSDVIRDLDKRLDAEWWPNGSSQLRGLRITSSPDDVMAEVSNAANSWSWAEWQFEMGMAQTRQPRFVWCGFGVISAWNDEPTPRYLFVKLLERLSLQPPSEPLQEN